MKSKKVSEFSSFVQIVLVAGLTQIGCERKAPAFVHRLAEFKASDLYLLFFPSFIQGMVVFYVNFIDI